VSRDSSSQRQARRENTLRALGKLTLNPGPVAAIMQCSGNDPDELVKVLGECPVLAGRVIGVANSAGSSAIHRMDSIERCVRHLGGKQARTVALTMAMQLMVQDLELDDELVRRLWVSATTKAVAAKLVADIVSPEIAETAYSLGLLQDIALPVLLTIDPDFFKQQLANGDSKRHWTALEREHFGIDHAEMGALLLQTWNAPPAMITQVARHHAGLDDDDMAWLAEMPCRVAGLLRHLDEQPTANQQQTLAATHTRFLADAYPSVELLIKEVHRRVKAMGKTAGGNATLDRAFIQRVTLAVAEDTFALASRISRLDHQLSQHVDALSHAQQDALSDPLTGLLNRRGFDSIGKQMLAQANKAGQPAACLVIDLDDFKPINDTLGHAAGDTVLRAAADLIKANVSPGDLVARVGGDEFVLLVVGDAQGDTHALAQRLHAVCNGRRIALEQGGQAVLQMSIGGVFVHAVAQNTTPDALVQAADQLMYRTKRAGKAGLSFEPMKKTAA